MTAYYNEFDPFAAAWLGELMQKGLIPNGTIDTRSITEVKPDDLRGYTQCHFFAGIGGWSRALQLAGWPADRPVWTGSCPCQPFSSAGKQKGKEDARHLWPVWFNLIGECRPATIFGEQVASAIAHGWLDDVYQDLEREGYACGSAVLPACSVGAPHKRDRLWFVADTESAGSPPRGQGEIQPVTTGPIGTPCEVANADSARPQGHGRPVGQHDQGGWQEPDGLPSEGGFWDSGIWIDCPDGKARLIEPSIPLLAHGIPQRVGRLRDQSAESFPSKQIEELYINPKCSNRVGRLRGYGNAIVPQVAAEFIKAYMECK